MAAVPFRPGNLGDDPRNATEGIPYVIGDGIIYKHAGFSGHLNFCFYLQPNYLIYDHAA
jgi:hypothetical protein